MPVRIQKDYQCVETTTITIDDMTFKQLKDLLLTQFHSIKNITYINCVKEGEPDLSSSEQVTSGESVKSPAESLDGIPQNTQSILLNVNDGDCTMRELPSIDLSNTDFQISDANSIKITKQTVMEIYRSQLSKKIQDNTQIRITASQKILSMEGFPETVKL